MFTKLLTHLAEIFNGPRTTATFMEFVAGIITLLAFGAVVTAAILVVFAYAPWVFVGIVPLSVVYTIRQIVRKSNRKYGHIR